MRRLLRSQSGKGQCSLELGHGLLELQKETPFVLPSVSWSPSCSWSGGRHVVVVVVVVATVVASWSQSSSLSSPWGHHGHSRGRVVAAPLHRSSSSLPLPPHIDMAVIVVVIVVTSELLRSQRSGRRGSSSRCRCYHEEPSSLPVFSPSSSLPNRLRPLTRR
ncbi:hypothetical protein EDB84DRAFT_1455121 [Lactarius hengduanensis]|nr:hypothetical protein EDB84DRAFT_1455121 [Lactarius hengduanensis]